MGSGRLLRQQLVHNSSLRMLWCHRFGEVDQLAVCGLGLWGFIGSLGDVNALQAGKRVYLGRLWLTAFNLVRCCYVYSWLRV